MPILTTSDLKVSYGELDVFSDLSLEVSERARIGMVGPNGAGKTSLLRVLVGELEPDGGSVQGATGIRIGYVPQVSQDASSDTLGNQIMSAFDELVRLERALADSALEIQTGDDRARREAERRYSSLLAEYETQGGYDYESRMERVAAGVGLSAEDLKTPAASASGGERTRAALATALLNEPGLLLLDEPTNYLDFKGLAWLEQFLAQSSHAFIAVSHDRYFLDRVATEIWEMDRGRVKTYRGSYTTYRALETERAARRQKEYDRQQEHIASEESFIDRYRAGQRARQARGREKRLDRLKETALIESPQAQRTIHIGGIPAASRAGQIVVSVKGLGVGFVEGDRSVELLSALDMKLEIGSRTAVIGSNGVGKTTLVQTILGMTPPLAGQATLGHNVKVGYHRQGSDDLPGSYTVLEAMQEYRNVSHRGGAKLPGEVPVPWGRCLQAGVVSQRWRAREVGSGETTRHRAKLPRAGRAYHPPGHPQPRGAGAGPFGVRWHTALHLSRPAPDLVAGPPALDCGRWNGRRLHRLFPGVGKPEQGVRPPAVSEVQTAYAATRQGRRENSGTCREAWNSHTRLRGNDR